MPTILSKSDLVAPIMRASPKPPVISPENDAINGLYTGFILP